MKKLISLFLFSAMIFCTSCVNQTVEPNFNTQATPAASTAGKVESNTSADTKKSADGEHEAQSDDQIEPIKSENSSILVAYFSATGTTEKLAEYAAGALGADLYEITPSEPYTDEDLAYYTDCRADREQADPSAKPQISGSVEDMKKYDTVILGYPIWHGQAPKIIYTFLESYDFSGMTIFPFCTSHSSGIGSSADNLHELAPKSIWLDGERFSADTSQKEIADWVENNIKKEETTMKISVNGHILKATLADTKAAQELYEIIKNEPLTIDLKEYGSFEKVGKLPRALTKSDEQLTAQPGDIMLYQGNQMTVFYGENSWSYTRLGKIENATAEKLSEIFGDGDVTVTVSVGKTEREFDFENKTVLLNSGYEMPIMGLGTYSLSEEECYNSVTALLEAGGRLIDTAYMYGNEAAVGRAIRDSDVPREDIFVITKIYPGEQYKNPEKAVQDTLDKLDIGYIDMMLLHHPGENDVNAYKTMEKFVEDGKIHSLGLSNFYVKELEEFLPQVDVMPALVQNEIHPYYQENDVIPYIQNLGIVVQGWYPFGGRGHTAELLGDPIISEIAENHGVTSAQVILRWNLQKGVVVIPGSSNPEHIRENLDLFGFELSEEEITQINALDRGEKHDWY